MSNGLLALAFVIGLAVIPSWLRMVRRGLGEPERLECLHEVPAVEVPRPVPEPGPEQVPAWVIRPVAQPRPPAPYRLGPSAPVRKSVAGTRRAIEGGHRG